MTTNYSEKRDLLFLPLGGSGEIGMNLNLYCTAGKWLMVDLGMTFADPNFPGIDLIFPDIRFIEDRREDLLGIVLTHGHEDHIGAVAHLWPGLKAPIYATPFTAELVKGKLAELGYLDEAEVHILPLDGSVKLGPFQVSYVALAHSIAEGNALKIETPHGTIFHTGDWKLDKNPQIGTPTSGKELSHIGEEGVLAMVGDSTNVFNPEASGSEQEVLDNLMQVVGEAQNRVIVTTFASNVARLQTVAKVAEAHDRSIAFMGRSMNRILDAAKVTGYLRNLPAIVPEENIMDIPRDKILVCMTGCQGEPRAALHRIADDNHRNMRLTSGDTVIFSSKIIPGNELVIGELVNKLIDKGAEVITEKDRFIHVSGHPGQPELRSMYQWIRPQIAIPVHGELRHMVAHAKLAKSEGVEHTLVPRNGKIIRLAPGKPEVVDEVFSGRLVLDGSKLVQADADCVLERRRLMHNGYLVLAVPVDEDGNLTGDIQVSAAGLPTYEKGGPLEDLILEVAEKALDKLGRKDKLKDSAIAEVVRIAARRAMKQVLAKKPVTEVLVIRGESNDW